MGSAISTPTYQAVNANIANDGSADSPRGYAISTDSNITMTIANTRVYVTAVTASRTVTLPTTSVKAGMVVEVQTACTSPYTIAINSSGANLIDTLKGTKGSIKLMALQDAPTAAAHWRVTDVYDEGTWTPVLSFGGASVGITYSTQAGVFSRIGNRCNISMRIVLTSKGSSTGGASISGAPYTSNTAVLGGQSVFSCNGNGISAGGYYLTPYIQPSSTSIPLVLSSSNGSAVAENQIVEIHVSNTPAITITGSYVIA